LPALANILDQVREMVEPLRTNGARLSSKAGQQALIALARLYQRMGRYSEAIPSFAKDGSRSAHPERRSSGHWIRPTGTRAQEQSWQTATPQSRSVSELRNDIQHAGFNQQPHDRNWFEQQLTTLLGQWQKAIDKMDQPQQG
jgi:hypothetical protein